LAQIIIMPRQGISVESCIITKWHKAKGDSVAAGDMLFSYETDKAAFDEKAAVSGVVLAVLCEEGDDVPCLDPVCVIGEAGEDISSLQLGGSAAPAEEAPAEQAPAAAAAPAALAAAPAAAPAGEGAAVSPRARAAAQRLGVDPALAAGTGPDGRVIERDILALSASGAASTKAAAAAGMFGQGGTALGGRVGIGHEGAAPQEAAAPVQSAPAPTEAEYEDAPLSNIRKVIARSMQQSLSEMAQLTHQTSFDATSIMDYRKRLKAAPEAMGVGGITLGDMVVYAVSRILLSHPDLNANLLDGKTMRRFNHVNMGIAVDTPRGLMVPTIFKADTLSLLEISKATKELAAACRSGSISPDLLSGGSFTVTNLGALGVEAFTPVINPPQTGILGVCGIDYKVRPGKDGGVTCYPAMGLSLTYDHRALDGTPASRFLKELCDALSDFTMLLAK